METFNEYDLLFYCVAEDREIQPSQAVASETNLTCANCGGKVEVY